MSASLESKFVPGWFSGLHANSSNGCFLVFPLTSIYLFLFLPAQLPRKSSMTWSDGRKNTGQGQLRWCHRDWVRHENHQWWIAKFNFPGHKTFFTFSHYLLKRFSVNKGWHEPIPYSLCFLMIMTRKMFLKQNSTDGHSRNLSRSE